MIKRHIEETVEEYDGNDNLISKTTTITDETDDNFYGSYWRAPKEGAKSGGLAI